MKTQRYILKCFLALFILSAYQNNSQASFFENTRRRPSVNEEKKYLVNINGCTGFFVKNDLNKNYVATARHCLKYSATDFCNKKGKIYDVKHDIYRTCEKIIAGSGEFDLVLFRVDGQIRDNSDALSLANFIPETNTRLTLVGFPADKFAHAGANTSENCWTLSSEIFFPWKDSPIWEKGARDPAIYHNCSTYGGNSGGPVIIEGSNIVVGLPFQYMFETYGNMGQDEKLTSFNLMSNFVNIFYNDLSRAGVKIERILNNDGHHSKYIRSGYYDSTIIKNCRFAVNSIYYTGINLEKLIVRYDGSDCSGYAIYTCNADVCMDDYGTKIIPQDNGFTYIGRSETHSYFSLFK